MYFCSDIIKKLAIVKFTKLFGIIGLCVCVGVNTPLELNAQNKAEKVVKYTVQPGETILGIAHRHGTTLDHLLSLNPGVKPDYVQSGQVLNVPYVPGGAEPAPTPEQRAAAAKAKAASTTVGGTNASVSSQTNSPKSVTTTWQPSKVTDVVVNKTAQQPKITYKTYKAKKKDTPYSLAKANNITVDELMDANPALKESGYKLKKGEIIRIPVKVYPPKPKFVGLKTIRVAVVLPLVGDGVEKARSVEFYRGMLMGIETLKQTGINVVVSAFNEPAPDVSIASLMVQVTSQQPDMIVGPLYPTHFTDVTSVSSKQTKVVVPFSSKVPQVDYRPEVYVLNTPATYESTLAMDLFLSNFKKQCHVVMLHSQNGSRKAFSEELQRRLSSAGYDVISLPMSSSVQHIASALLGKKNGEYIIVPDDASENTMKQMLNVTTNLQQSLLGAQISLLGFDSWIPYTEGVDRKRFHDADTYILSSNYYYPYTAAAKTFHANYESNFKTDFLVCNPRMAPLGYDFARGFMGNLAVYGHDFNTQSAQDGTIAAEPKLQSDPRFITVGGNGGYVSRSMWLVHFKKDMSIVKISAQ